jgi:ribosomal protein S18 acetylase RimI-like enzyme
VFHATDPQGFLIGLFDSEPIACISVVAYDLKFGFLGFYIVKPEFRGRGFGLQIWQRGIERLADRNIGLDGVPDQQSNYRKSGFTLAYRNIRYEGVARDGTRHATDETSEPELSFAEALDREVFPADRTGFLRRWLTLPDRHALALNDGGVPAGYGVIRRCRSGYKVGPLFAKGDGIAERLFQALIARVEPDAPIFLDVPEVNHSAVRMAERNGMKPAFETARMYNKGEPKLRLDMVFGVTTFELG